jgi:two-component system cell cycle sensor histidine kinase/response regulator CckA
MAATPEIASKPHMDPAILKAALGCVPCAVMITDVKGVVCWVNASFATITGYAPEEAIGRTPRILKSGRHDEAFYETMWGTILSGRPWHGEVINRRKNGDLYFAEQTICPVAEAGGSVGWFVSIQRDTTERKQYEETLRGFDPSVISRLEAAVSGALATGSPRELEMEVARPDGATRSLLIRGEAVRDEQGSVSGLRGAVQDVTERKRASRELRDRDTALQAVINATNDSVLLLDSEGTVLVANEPVAARLGTTAEAMRGGCVFDLLPPEVAAHRRARLREAIESDRTIRFEDSRGDALLESCVYPIHDETGKVTRVAVYSRDITEARRADEALRESERRFTQLLENVGVLAVVVDRNWTINFCNDHLLRVTGWSRDELIGSNWLERCVPAHEREKLKERFRKGVTGNQFPLHYGNAILTKAGAERWIEWDNSPLLDPDGRLAGTASLGRDLTEQRSLEEQFRQSQKLEAVGRLAGGVAHDFNNLLTVIGGYADLLLEAVHRRDPARRPLEAIRTASHRATDLVHQLLAFSRKQLLQPKLLDVSDVLSESARMLRRLIGEHIELTFRSDPALPAIEADPSQIQQVIMNLALNGRDSMPEGGTLAIAASFAVLDENYTDRHPDVRPGHYVKLAFADTGHGMDQATRERIFEPFFTTKEVGKGTGLGLATVYGIVKQSGGHIAVTSEPGRGTTFEIYLPAVERMPQKRTPRKRTVAAHAKGTIVVTEDDGAVRAFTSSCLRRAGHKVLEAADAAEALAIFRTHQAPIELLITDVVMPGLGGLELAERIRSLRPGTKVLFVSGYASRRRHPRVSGAAFLPKPYSPHDLNAAVQRMLRRRQDV